MSSSRDTLGRSLALGLGLVALLSLGGWFVFERFVVTSRPAVVAVEASPPEVRPAPVVVSDVRATVVEVVGLVERTRGEKWVELHVGDALELDDSVRTGPGSRADLQVGDEASRLSIPERSEVRVGEVTRAVHAFQLSRGRIDVDYGAREDRVLRVRSENGTVVETREARFTMLHNGAMVAVATHVGSVLVSSGGGSVQVGAGHQSVVFDGAKPMAAEPIPLKVLLKVAAKASSNSALCLSLSGKVRPGSQVFVEDAPTEVSRDGSFHAEVPQRKGLSKVRVLAREPGGGTREMLVACRPRARARPSQAESVKFRWEEGP